MRKGRSQATLAVPCPPAPSPLYRTPVTKHQHVTCSGPENRSNAR